MTRDELITALHALRKETDYERGHQVADAALLSFIDDIYISDAFYAVKRHYA